MKTYPIKSKSSKHKLNAQLDKAIKLMLDDTGKKVDFRRLRPTNSNAKHLMKLAVDAVRLMGFEVTQISQYVVRVPTTQEIEDRKTFLIKETREYYMGWDLAQKGGKYEPRVVINDCP